LAFVARVLVLALVWLLVLAGCGGGSDDETAAQRETPSVLPGGGEVPAQRITDLERAARAAGCELQSTRAQTREHTADIEEPIDYDTNPPTAGKHFQLPAEDGIYEEPAPDTSLVHSLEHGRVLIWFRPSLPERARAGLRALVEDNGFQMLLMPRSEMPFAVAASAWNRGPGPAGTGRLLGCASFEAGAYDAFRAFRDKHRGRGPEASP
jgi:hypothetical protein